MSDFNTNTWDQRYNRPRILLDMDDCINNFLHYLCRVYNKRTGSNLKVSEIKDWEITKYMGQEGLNIFKEEGFFSQVGEKRHSVDTLKKLIESTKYDVYVISACHSVKELEEKVEWFAKYLPEFDPNRIIRCREKEIIRGDVLVDDRLENLHKCSPFMKCIVFDMPHNRNCSLYPRVKRLEDIIPIIDEWFYPNGGGITNS